MSHFIRPLIPVVVFACISLIGTAALPQDDITELVDTGVPGGNDLLVDGARFVSGYFDAGPKLVYHDTASRTTTPIGDLSISYFQYQIEVSGDWVVFIASEEFSGRDLNGDNDTRDGVPQVFHIPTGALSNLGVAASNIPNSEIEDFGLASGFLVFACSEREENQIDIRGRDLNGDRDVLDDILCHYELATGELTMTRIDILPQFFASDKVVAFIEYEQQVEPFLKDKNGDGDTNDFTPVVLDFSTGAPVRHEPAIAGRPVGTSESSFVSIFADETHEGRDLNGNGTTSDLAVAFVYDPATGRLVNLELAINVNTWSGDVLAFEVPEPSQGESLNRDADMSDQVLHVYDARTGDTTNLGLATGFQLWAAPGQVLFHLREANEDVDANGDGDTLDNILEIYDVNDGSLYNTRIDNVQALVAQGDQASHAMLTISELAVGQDLNGDGDMTDPVLHTLRFSDGNVENLGVAGFGYRASWNDRFIVSVDERGQGGIDRNGNGTTTDRVLAFFEPGLGEPTNLGYIGRATGLSAEIFAVSLFEAQESKDLNGDGDLLDRLVKVHAFRGTPREELIEIIETVGETDTSVARALVAHLENALKWLDRGDIGKTVDALNQVIQQLQQLPPQVVDPEEAEALIVDVNALIDQLTS